MRSVANGVIYITSGYEAVYAGPAAEGSLVWKSLHNGANGSPIGGDGVVYVGPNNGRA